MLFRNVVIFGAGTMGHAIALRFARGGHAVTLTDDLRARSPSSWEEKRRKASWPG